MAFRMPSRTVKRRQFFFQELNQLWVFEKLYISIGAVRFVEFDELHL